MHEDFIEQRVRIAKRHVQIGLHRKWYTRLSRTIPLYHEDFANKITTIEDFSHSINVINKLFTLEQELVLDL